ncbi:acetyl-coenzyme A synthetase 2-like, mitochondrial isoform X5 [Latimeria chalumnae]|uniref:acetyl-coenzyme A synthetase 2-like, mitochondrial isoform X5 n=1 Tax=Latimeria chalumnae TaxID=7897 RepID=UPI0006D907E5|nr:PREDICTED: acetyl-coenzyme A synthetase 2-like, mitochondrial isoform X4 [Latimeria chalumnae]|eukprot:XP_014341702.1 PREDICTED: acetyl-coenzyme A synthetase 2-like, mitochondrial isoform X4 [Latimeria chalumnae]
MPLLRAARAMCRHQLWLSFSPKLWKTFRKLQTLSARGCSGFNLPSYMPEAAAFHGVTDHSGLYDFSVQLGDTFWGAVGRERLSWITPFHTVHDCDFKEGRIKWFEGGQLNVSVNCLDRHVHWCPDRVALIWEKDEPGTEVRITYRQLLELTCQLANTLKHQGVRKGDRVTIYMPSCPLAVAAMMACARIGAIHTVVFAGFSSEALASRIQDAQSETVITANQGVRGGKVIELKKMVDEAVKMCPSVRQVLVAMRTDAKVPMSDIDVPLEEEMKKEDVFCEPVAMESEDILFLLYTSGSTGKPKGLVHTQAGYLLYAALTQKYVFDYHDGDVFGCVADIGWITGHSYVVYGTLCNGGTSVLFESTPVYPNPETGGICIAPRPSHPEAEIVPAMAMRPFFGIRPALLDEKGNLLSENNISGALCISQAWPGMARTIYNDHNRFVETYLKPYPNNFFTGDGAFRSKEGYYQIIGRLDDVLNVSGHRLGTAEIEDVVNQHPAMAESAVIGYPHEIKGEGVYVFVVLKDGADIPEDCITKELKELVSLKIAKYAAPDYIQVTKRLPKTRSGKIMRRVLRKIVENKANELGDLTTLDDHETVQEIIDGHRLLLARDVKQ